VQFRERQAARDPADPTNTCSRRSAVPRGTAPGATSSGLPLSSLPDDRAFRSRQRLRGPGGRCADGVGRRVEPVRRPFRPLRRMLRTLAPKGVSGCRPGRSQVAAPASHPVSAASRRGGAREVRAVALHPRSGMSVARGLGRRAEHEP
jgi:hypothetical protein